MVNLSVLKRNKYDKRKDFRYGIGSLAHSFVQIYSLASVSTGVVVAGSGCAEIAGPGPVSSTVRTDVADGRRFGVLFRQRDRLPVPPVVDYYV